MFTRRDVIAATAATVAFGLPKMAQAQSSVNISIADSPLPQALDIYYDSLIRLCQANGFGSADKLVLNNTITSFDISADTPYFNEGLFRRFADRIYLRSPDEVGPAAQADRYSVVYERLLRTVATQVDQRHPEIVPKLRELDDALDRVTRELNDLVMRLEAQWTTIAQSRGLTRGTPEYELQQITYFEQIRYPDQVSSRSARISDYLIRKEQVRRSVYSPAETLLLETVEELSEFKKIARPLRPTYERSNPNVNDLTFANPVSTPVSLCDVSHSSYPLGDLGLFLRAGGQRAPIDITRSSSTTNHHDEAWGARASASIPFFGIGGSGGGSGASGYTNAISNAAGLRIAFDNIAEVLVDRGGWFNPALFANRDLARLIYAQPDVNRLKYIAVSLVICRGLSLSLTSNVDIDRNSWSTQTIGASGGASFFGFRFGGSASRTTNDWSVFVSEDGRTVTFKDDPAYCRLVAVRLVEAAGNRPTDRLTGEFAGEARPRGPLSRFVTEEQLRQFRAGRINYRQLMGAPQ